MITIPNTIKNINPDYRILSTRDLTNSVEMFRDQGRFKIEILVNLNKSNKLLRKAKYIEVYLMSNNSTNDFSRQFKNSLLSETNNNKKYIENENFNNFFKKDIRKNLFTEYNSSYNSSLSYNKIFEFDQENFVEENSETYKLLLDQDFSKKIYTKSIRYSASTSSSNYFNNIRIAILDEKYNIIDISRFHNIDFSNNALIDEVEIVDINEYYRPQITSFVESLSLDFNVTNQIQVSNSTLSNTLGLDNLQYQIYLSFNNIQIQTTYFSTENIIVISLDNTTGGLLLLQRFLREISTNYYLGQQEFNIFLTFSVKQEGSPGPIHTVQRVLSISRDDTFIENIARRQELPIITNLFNSIDQSSLGNNIQYQGPKFGIPLNINTNDQEDNQFWQLIKINSIKINDQELDFFYKNPSFSIENKVEYKEMTYKELFIDNNFTIWRNLSQYLSAESIQISITLEYNVTAIQRTIRSSEIVLNTGFFEENSSFVPNSLNQAFKENLNCTGISPSFNLNESNRSIFLYDSFVLNNIEYLNDISSSYGYDSTPNFLRNCKIKINKAVSINGITSNNYVYANFDEMFNINSNNFLVTNNSYLNSLEFLDLVYNDFGENSRYSNESLVYEFLSTTNKTEKLSILQRMTSINIGNNLELEILPIPKIIHDNIGCGFDSINNIDIRDNTGTVSEFENTLLLYLGNINTGIKDQIKRLMFTENNIITENLVETLLYYFKVSNGLNQSNFYTNNISYNKNQISSLINTQEESEDEIESTNILNSEIINRQLSASNYYYDFSQDENIISYSNIPLFVNFKRKKIDYNKEENCYLPQIINFLYKVDDQIMLNTQNVQKVFNVSRFPEFLSFTDIKRNNFGITNASIKVSFHIILSKLESYDSSRNLISEIPEDVIVTSYNGKSCTYNFKPQLELDYRQLKSYLQKKQLDYTVFRSLFNFSKSNRFVYLEDIILRTHLKFDIENNTIDTIFTSKIPFLNYENDSIKIDNIREITTRLQ